MTAYTVPQPAARPAATPGVVHTVASGGVEL